MLLDDMLEYNKKFVNGKKYEPYQTNNIPNKRTVIFTCMDTRLVELLPKALNIQNGDVKMVKNAGAILRDPFDSVMKSILVAIYELKAEQVMVIGHHDCGMSHADPAAFKQSLLEKGVAEETLATLANAGVDLENEFKGFDDVEDSVRDSASVIRNHPLLPSYADVHGLVIDPETGKVDLVTNG
ncbi:carbonic anhydrase [Lentibacillus sp. CBA3610]|uniref:beta-class carbonic anhydrase n=1 Tax=Lentibacillus sp. CBA3610 TaxID=2518176 RepID=UPI00159544A9|nr:carbonic anhydrase [Lentibacillus sp. CBA3610]QKY68472.1 carbonic anhydrase [Lentibacillus sp. CBA3610]